MSDEHVFLSSRRDTTPLPWAPDLGKYLSLQNGVVTRTQLLSMGFTDQRIRTARARDWRSIHPGVYLTHTGQPTWDQRAWAGVLAAWPAALSHQSVLGRMPSMRDPDRIHVAVRSGHRVRHLNGVVVHELLAYDERVVSGSPPRIRTEEAVLDMATRAHSAWDEVSVLCEAAQVSITTARRLIRSMDARLRVRHREFLRAVLCDIASGTRSALEQAYLVLVERAHDLPIGVRQQRGRRQHVFRDVVYPGTGLAVELDGRAFHTDFAGWQRDLMRDLTAKATEGLDTVRLSWRQVVGQPCETARMIGVLLNQRGWGGTVVPCRECR